ncbi:MAG: SurA N-terminal domain-containing protein [Burkholderiaceae bacterium]
MFDFVRSHNRLLQVLLGLLIVPSFAIFGVQSYTRMNGDEAAAVAEVDGRDVTRVEWDNQQRESVERIRMQRPGVDPKTLDSPQSKRQTLDAIVGGRGVVAAGAPPTQTRPPPRGAPRGGPPGGPRGPPPTTT